MENNINDLSNVEGLDTNVSGIYDERGVNIMKATDPFAIQYGVNAVNNGKYKPQNELIYAPQAMIDLGADGSGNKKNKITDLRLASMPHGNPHTEFDIQYGVDSNVVDLQYGATGDQPKLTPEEIAALHEKSGSGKSLKDWLNSGGLDKLLGTTKKVSDTIKQIKGGQGLTIGSGTGKSGDAADLGGGSGSSVGITKSETKILGMSPITFGFVAFGVIAVASVVTIVLIKKSKASKAASASTAAVTG